MDEKNRFYENQQCLDYLGDDKLTSSPEQICKKSSREISNILRTLRLRHCCERNVYSAFHDDGMSAVIKGGKECEQILKNLIDADALASRITCGLNEILFRYDCRQVYSITHGCNDCKVIVLFHLSISIAVICHLCSCAFVLLYVTLSNPIPSNSVPFDSGYEQQT